MEKALPAAGSYQHQLASSSREVRNNTRLPILTGNFQMARKHVMMSLFWQLTTAVDKL